MEREKYCRFCHTEIDATDFDEHDAVVFESGKVAHTMCLMLYIASSVEAESKKEEWKQDE